MHANSFSSGDAFTNSVALVAVGVVAVIFNSFIITRYGRRRVFLISGLLLCAAAMLVEAVAYTINPKSESVRKLIVGISVVYIFGYNGMISSYAWVSGGELPCQRLRSSTFGLAASVGFLGAWLTTYVLQSRCHHFILLIVLSVLRHHTSSTRLRSIGAQNTATFGYLLA